MTDAEKQVAELRKKRDDLKKALKAAERRRIGAIERRLRRAESRLRGQARRDDTRRLILRGRLSERKLEQASLTDPNARARNRDELDAFLTRDRDRALFDLPGLVGPSEHDSPLPGWNPKKLPDGSWGAAFSGDTAALLTSSSACPSPSLQEREVLDCHRDRGHRAHRPLCPCPPQARLTHASAGLLVFRFFPSKEGFGCFSGRGRAFLWFLDPVGLSTGVVAPTTCSVLLVLNYLYG